MAVKKKPEKLKKKRKKLDFSVIKVMHWRGANGSYHSYPSLARVCLAIFL